MPGEAATRKALIIVYLGIGVLLCIGAAENEAEPRVMKLQGAPANEMVFPWGVWIPLKGRGYRFHSVMIVAQNPTEYKFSGWMPWIVRGSVIPPSLAECSLFEYNASV